MDEEEAKVVLMKIFGELYDQVIEPDEAMEQFEKMVVAL